MTRFPGPGDSRSAFTLLEILGALFIISVLAFIIVGSLTATGSSELTAGSNITVEQLALAREMAVSGNYPTEVWFLRKKDGTWIESLQIFRIDEKGRSVPSGKLQRLPQSVGIDSGELSTLFKTTTVKQWPDPADKPSIHPYGKDYDCWHVCFRLDGSASLAKKDQWYLTLHLKNLGDQLKALPPNYAVVGVSPSTGKVTLYRP